MEYDESTGELFDTTGNFITNWTNLHIAEPKEPTVEEVKDLIKSGLSTEEIIELRKKGIL